MSVPKKRRTKSAVGKRRSHHSLKSINLIKCEKCGGEIVAHTACIVCGTYNGREVIDMNPKTTTKKSDK